MTTSADIRARLIEKYPFKDGWITMAEVTPPKCQRRFDLIAIMGWQSRGHVAMGFEIKVARSDWLRELAEPAKADPLVTLCSRWWIAAPPGVVEVSELPPAWGLLVVHPEQIRTVKQAPELDPEAWPDAVWRCMLLRCATREIRSPDELDQARNKGWAEGRQSALNETKADSSHAEKRADELQQIINHWLWSCDRCGAPSSSRDMPARSISLLPTPTVHGNTNSAGSSANSGDGLRTALVKLLPTPLASDGQKGGPNQRFARGNPSLIAMLHELMPTPRAAADALNGGSNNAAAVRKRAAGRFAWVLGGRLNPAFVEAMMLCPIDWTAFASSATVWSRRKPRSPSANSLAS